MSSLHTAPASTSRSEIIRARANAFCLAFVTGASPAEILDEHFTATDPSITEHGSGFAHVRLPYLGRTFRRRKTGGGGASTCDDYFDLLGATLAFHSLDKTLPAPQCYIVDAESKHIPGKLEAGDSREDKSDADLPRGSGAALVKAHARIEALKSGAMWEEDFVFLMSEFDAEGRIGHLEIWSDNLSAWQAVGE